MSWLIYRLSRDEERLSRFAGDTVQSRSREFKECTHSTFYKGQLIKYSKIFIHSPPPERTKEITNHGKSSLQLGDHSYTHVSG